MIAVMNIPKMEVAPASAAAAAEGFPEHMGALSVGIDHGYGKVEDVREQHAKELQRDKKNDEAKAEAAAAKAPLEAAPEAPADPAPSSDKRRWRLSSAIRARFSSTSEESLVLEERMRLTSAILGALCFSRRLFLIFKKSAAQVCT